MGWITVAQVDLSGVQASIDAAQAAADAAQGTADSAAAAAAAAAAPNERGNWRDVKAANTAGGTFTQDAWRTRDLNGEVYNDIAGASLSSNRVTLPAGTYLVSARAPALGVGHHRLRVWDATNDVLLALSGCQVAGAATSSQTDCVVVPTPVVLADEVEVELQHYCDTTRATNGLGLQSGFDSQVEVYAELVVERLA